MLGGGYPGLENRLIRKLHPPLAMMAVDCTDKVPQLAMGWCKPMMQYEKKILA